MAITQIDKVLYTAKAHTIGGRDGGSSRTSDGHLDVKLSVPGGHGEGTNPEQLFAAGWSSCFLSALKIVAARSKVRLPSNAAVDAEVDLGTTNGGYHIQARLSINLPGIDHETAQKLADGAHQECPYVFQGHARQHQRGHERDRRPGRGRRGVKASAWGPPTLSTVAATVSRAACSGTSFVCTRPPGLKRSPS